MRVRSHSDWEWSDRDVLDQVRGRKEKGLTADQSCCMMMMFVVTHDPFSSGMMNPDASGRAEDPAQK